MKFGTFNDPIDVIGTGRAGGLPPAPSGPPVEKELKPSKSAAVILEPLHDAPFRCSNPPKRGNHSTISKFPNWKGDPPK